MERKFNKILYYTCWLQGGYFFLSGIWPLLHIHSFLLVSGPKVDIWLTKSFGTVLAVIGLVLLYAAISKSISRQTFLLAVGIAIAVSIVEVYYVIIERIWPTYLIDAFVEAIFILLWIIAYRK